MPNTRIAKIQRDIPINNQESQVIIGSILGDGSLCQSGKNYRLRIEHKADHLEYVQWKFQWLNRLCIAEPQFNSIHNSCRFGTIGHPDLTSFHSLFYREQVKVIPDNIIEYFTPLCLAIWFMDDGNKIHNTVSISVHNYSESDLNKLRGLLFNFGIKVNIHFDGHGKRLYIPTYSYLAFERLVKPYVENISCMAHKLP